KILVSLLSKIKAKINLIPFNPHDQSDFQPPDAKTLERFQTILLDKRYTTMVRYSKGQDIGAACGQLAGKEQTEEQTEG
ncbi:23S rRNA (adenine(2503)-C(2))-methyltransferase RlmN, partial [Desulfobacterales bacterium HSG17]|nr:23S rRNA (adenine(2503)-C(2))-methyltransferase RlmN [Desulfobacterales bacterium HSG17]